MSEPLPALAWRCRRLTGHRAQRPELHLLGRGAEIGLVEPSAAAVEEDPRDAIAVEVDPEPRPSTGGEVGEALGIDVVDLGVELAGAVGELERGERALQIGAVVAPDVARLSHRGQEGCHWVLGVAEVDGVDEARLGSEFVREVVEEHHVPAEPVGPDLEPVVVGGERIGSAAPRPLSCGELDGHGAVRVLEVVLAVVKHYLEHPVAHAVEVGAGERRCVIAVVDALEVSLRRACGGRAVALVGGSAVDSARILGFVAIDTALPRAS